MVYISFDFDNIFSLHLFYSRLIHSPFYQMVQCCCFFVWGGGGGGGGGVQNAPAWHDGSELPRNLINCSYY